MNKTKVVAVLITVYAIVVTLVAIQLTSEIKDEEKICKDCYRAGRWDGEGVNCTEAYYDVGWNSGYKKCEENEISRISKELNLTEECICFGDDMICSFDGPLVIYPRFCKLYFPQQKEDK